MGRVYFSIQEGCSYYNFTIGEKEKVTGEIFWDDYFYVYFLTPRNFTRFNNGEDFNYEYGTERASKMIVSFVPKKPGRFYCVIHNESSEDIDVDAKLCLAKIEKQDLYQLLED